MNCTELSMSDEFNRLSINTEWGVVTITKDSPPYFIQHYILFALVKEGQVVRKHGICADWILISNTGVPWDIGKEWCLYKIDKLDPIEDMN